MKGILFTEVLYNKTVRKEKTMTRRAGKSLAVINEAPDDWRILHSTLFSNGCLNVGFTQRKLGQGLTWHNCKSNYRVGEVLYIKEPVADYRYEYFTGQTSETRTAPAYKYGCKEGHAVIYGLDGKPRIIPSEGLKFSNKLFMGADKARHYIRITDVRIERLYDISDEDCLKEGIDVDKAPYRDDFFYDYQENDYSYISPQKSFFSLFRFANNYPKKKEIPNLWVWVYSYYLCDKSGNKL